MQALALFNSQADLRLLIIEILHIIVDSLAVLVSWRACQLARLITAISDNVEIFEVVDEGQPI